jgi:hypothetical protein
MSLRGHEAQRRRAVSSPLQGRQVGWGRVHLQRWRWTGVPGRLEAVPTRHPEVSGLRRSLLLSSHGSNGAMIVDARTDHLGKSFSGYFVRHRLKR